MTATLLASLLLAMPSTIQINVNANTGDLISGEKAFRVTVVADDPVTQVEFYVGDELRDTDTSTPYEFKIDTLSESDGDLKITFAAYTTTGESAKKSLTFKVDNGLEKGVAFHVDKAKGLVSNSKWDEAIDEGRIALKIDPQNGPAKLVMAQAYLGKGVLDKAQKYAEDAIAVDPNSAEANQLLGSIKLQQAFSTFNRSGGDRAETQALIKSALADSITNRLDFLQKSLEAIGQPTDANLKDYADAAMRLGRYNLVVTALQPAFDKDATNNDIADRLVYAQVRAGKWNDALQTMNRVQKYGAPDAYGMALLGVIYGNSGMQPQSDAAMRDALLDDATNLGVQTAQAYLALRRNDTGALSRLATTLSGSAGYKPEVNYYVSAVLNAQSRYAESRTYFERAVLAEPASEDIYIEQANKSMAISLTANLSPKDAEQQRNVARLLLETALKVRGDSPQALTGLALVNALDRKVTEAVNYARAAMTASPDYTAGVYALAASLNLANPATSSGQMMIQEANRLKMGFGKLDPMLEGRQIPTPRQALAYFVQYGRNPVLAPPA